VLVCHLAHYAYFGPWAPSRFIMRWGEQQRGDFCQNPHGSSSGVGLLVLASSEVGRFWAWVLLVVVSSRGRAGFVDLWRAY